MDIWSKEQLRRMQLGGTRRFQQFLSSYPRLRDSPQTPAALSSRYVSRAAAYYGRLLDARCGSGDDAALEPPPIEDGHLPADELIASPRPDFDACNDDAGDEKVGSLEEEQAALEAFCLKQKRKSKRLTPAPLSPHSRSSDLPHGAKESPIGANACKPLTPSFDHAITPTASPANAAVQTSTAATCTLPPTEDAVHPVPCADPSVVDSPQAVPTTAVETSSVAVTAMTSAVGSIGPDW